MRGPRLLLYVALVLAAVHFCEKVDAAPQLPLVHADYQRCMMVHTAPLIDHPVLEGEKPPSDFT